MATAWQGSACSAFGGTDAPGPNVDGAAVQPDGGDAATHADGAAQADGGGDPCAASPSGLTGTYLWVVAGYDPTSNAGQTSILRAPLHCDGSLDAFMPVSTTVPNPGTRGAGALLGDTVLLVGGQRASGATDGRADYAFFDAKGDLGPFTAVAAPQAATFRPSFASDPTHLVVAGGLGSTGSRASLWTLEGGALTVAELPAMPVPLAQGTGMVQGDTAILTGLSGDGGTSPLLETSTSTPLAGWTRALDIPQTFDCGSAATDTAIFVASGYIGSIANELDVTVFKVTGGAFGQPLTFSHVLPAGSYLPGVAIARGHLYVVGGTDAGDVSYGTLNATLDGLLSSAPFVKGPSLPQALMQPTVFVH
jgi:hypothetical protein